MSSSSLWLLRNNAVAAVAQIKRQLLPQHHNLNAITTRTSIQPLAAAAATQRRSFATTVPAHYQHQRRQQHFSRFSATLIMTGSDTVRLTDYDLIGFDLDNTLVRYRIAAMTQLQYDALARNLVERHAYAGDRLLRPLAEHRDFMQRGLICDLRRGNVLKVGADGFIRRAAHGTRFLSEAEIVGVYGVARKWAPLVAYTADLLSTWNGPAADEMRTLLDYFDMPVSVLFARCVDTVDAKAGGGAVDLSSCSYDIMPGILDGLYRLYSREHFAHGDSEFFEALKRRPADYIHRTPAPVCELVRQLRQHAGTFLLTGSHIDFAAFTAAHALGADWRELFDAVVCFAKKPGFFEPGVRRPFLGLRGAVETEEPVAAEAMRLDGESVYSQGNYAELLQLLGTKRAAEGDNRPLPAQPKVLYIGDNMVQDVYAPFARAGCDTIAIVEELRAESGDASAPDADEADELLRSAGWGSYFGSASEPTLWADVIQRNARVCVADVAELAARPLDHAYGTFTPDRPSCSKGFWPAAPRGFEDAE